MLKQILIYTYAKPRMNITRRLSRRSLLLLKVGKMCSLEGSFILRLDTTPQAPQNVQYKQSSSNFLLSWEPGYDGGRPQYFII